MSEENLYDTAPVGLWRTNLDDGRFIHANEAAIKILGFSDFDDLSSHIAADIYGVKERNELIKDLRRHNEVNNLRLIMKRKDGKSIAVCLTAKINEEDNFIEGTITDMTGIIDMDDVILPYLEKISELKRIIFEKIKGDCCDSEPLRHSTSKTA